MKRTRMTPEEWERRVEWPMAIASVVFLAAYSWLILEPDMPGQLRHFLVWIDYLTWGAFVIDYVVRICLARQRLRYVLHHPLDLIVVVVPVLRPLRLLRMIALVRVLDRLATRSLQGRVAAYVVVASSLVIYSGALAELQAERGAEGSNIEDFGTSLWWAITTVTTVGYGDHYPVTMTGRVVAVVLMFAGVALLSTVTATLSSWFVGRVRGNTAADTQPHEDELRALREDLHRVTDELSRHREALAAAVATAPGRPDS